MRNLEDAGRAFVASKTQKTEQAGFCFGKALLELKAGRRVQRKGWNGRGMFLILVPGSEGLTVAEGMPLAKAGVPVGTKFNYRPHIDLWSAQGDFGPWFASPSDVLADDWQYAE